MKNFGVSLLDITNLDGALRISLGGIWIEQTGLKNGRSLLAVEVDKTGCTINVFYMRFMFEI